jgi:hypothetical protein
MASKKITAAEVHFDGRVFEHILAQHGDDLVAHLNGSPAGQAAGGNAAKIHRILDVEVIESRPCTGYEVHDYNGLVSRHRFAHRAIARANKEQSEARAYACTPNGLKRIGERKGDVTEGNIYDGTRYLIDGKQYVLCADNHFERAESRDTKGQLNSWYTYIAGEEASNA